MKAAFIDRDGVINKKIENGYVTNWNEFQFIDGSIEAIAVLSKIFHLIIIVTNQRGVGKGIMSKKDLDGIHQKMNNVISENGGRIDKIYSCLDVNDNSVCRKPNIGMGIQAFADFPLIDLRTSVVIGDSISDMQFAQNLGIPGILISNNRNADSELINASVFSSIFEFSNYLQCL